jgi:preprotein translocase subunit SecF
MRKLMLLVVLVLIVAGAVYLGFTRDWLNLRTQSATDQGQTEVTLTVDKNKVKQDLAAARDKATEVKEEISEAAAGVKEEVKDKAGAAKEAVAGQKLEGTIEAINDEPQSLVIKARDKDAPVTVRIDKDTKIRVGDREGNTGDLRVGDEVTIQYDATEGGHVARNVTVLPKK